MLTFQINNSKITLDLDDFLSLLESMMQQPLIQLLQFTICFYWDENFDYGLMDIWKNNWDSPEYVVSLLNSFCNITIKKKIRIRIQYLQNKLKSNTNVHVNEILFNPFTLVPFIKVLRNPKIQMEHSHLIIEFNETQKK